MINTFLPLSLLVYFVASDMIEDCLNSTVRKKEDDRYNSMPFSSVAINTYAASGRGLRHRVHIVRG